MNDVALGKLVQHRRNQGELGRCSCRVGNGAKRTNRVAGRLVEVLVVNALGLDLADALQRRFMVSHD